MQSVVRERTATTHSNARRNLLPGNPLKTFYSLRPALFLPRIVLWIHVSEILGAYTMNLEDGFFASPDEVIGLGLDDYGATGG